MGYLGQLTNVLESGKVDVTYYYDSIGRMISRKDNYGHTLQMIYSNAMNPSEITHVYNFTSRQLHTLLYDDQGYIIALDNCKLIRLYVVSKGGNGNWVNSRYLRFTYLPAFTLFVFKLE